MLNDVMKALFQERRIPASPVWAVVIVASLCTYGWAAEPAEPAAWWNVAWPNRTEVQPSTSAETLVRVPLPEGAKSASVRCVLEGYDKPLPHWTQTIEITEPVRVAASPEVHYGFPRMVRAANGDLLLFYRVGISHATDHSSIALQRSGDGGKSWSERRILWQDEEGFSAHNPVALVARDGRVILWVSRFQYASNKVRLQKSLRQAGLWSHSDDHGQTWSQFTLFDASHERNSYYIADAIQTDDGLLAGSDTFPPTGIEPCYGVIWHSSDDGRTWSVRSLFTQPEENLGDEVALLQTAPGRLLCLLRDRRRTEFYRLWSNDNGRTWSEREPLRDMFGCVFQRPFLTRLDAHTVLASGRDYEKKQVVAYVSRDNGRSFGERHVLENYQADGAYTAAVNMGNGKALMTWYTDEGVPAGMPDIKTAMLTVLPQAATLWVRLPRQRSPGSRLFVYFGNDAARIAEDRVDALLRPQATGTAALGSTEQRDAVAKQ